MSHNMRPVNRDSHSINPLDLCDNVSMYLVEKLSQLKKVARVRVIPESLEVRVETLEDGEWELSTSAPIVDNRIPVSILVAVGRFSEAGYKLVFMG